MEHYDTIANYPPSFNAANVLWSRHLDHVWHRLGLNRLVLHRLVLCRKFISLECEVDDPAPEPVVDADVEVDEMTSDLSVDR